MKHVTLAAAVFVIVLANAFALAHAWRNRSGAMDADITLTQRELPLAYNADKEDNGVSLDLQWTDAAWAIVRRQRAAWLDGTKLRELGFDTSVAPSAKNAVEFYNRQRARRVFVALEYNGPAWRKYLEEAQRADEEGARSSPANARIDRESESHLIAIDAALDAVRLRSRHPDRNSVIVAPAVARIFVMGAADNPTLTGAISEVPTSIHAPRPFSDIFRRLPDRSRATYRVHLRYGADLEPWIVGVESPGS